MGVENTRCSCCFAPKQGPGSCPKCGCDENTQNAPHQLQIGTVLKEQYQIGKVLGQGGFGITYLGWDLYLDIPVAIKEYYPSGMVMREATVTMNVADVTGDDGARFRNNRDRFLREAKMLARFSQIHEVVQIKNFFLANNTAYIVMEYVEGITLKHHVKNSGGKLTSEETFAILGPVIQTMAKVHKTGIIHRDISPDNIMMVSGGAKLLDFGAVRDVTGAAVDKELTKSTEAILKQGYAPIEQYQKKGALGPWTDVYALCATIYYCLTGEIPPDSPARVLEYEVLELDNLPGLTQQQKAALRHGLELRSDKRTGSMEELYQELFAVPEPQKERTEVVPPARKPEAEPPKVEKPREEKPKAEKPKAEKPKVEKPKAEKPKLEKPKAKKAKPSLKAVGIAVGTAAVLLIALAVLILPNIGGDADGGKQLPENVLSGKCGASAWWRLDLDTGVMKINGTYIMYDFYLDEYDENQRRDYDVARPWEEYTDIITEVIFEDNIYRIGQAAFAHCSNLTKVTFGKQLKEIGMDAFWDTGLTEIQLPEGINLIEGFAFEHTQLREVTLPATLDHLDEGVFSDCPQLTKVTIPGSTYWCYDTRSRVPEFSAEGNSTEDITLCGLSDGIVEEYANISGYRFESTGETKWEGQGDFSAYPGNVDGRWYFDRQTHFLKIEGEMPTDMVGMWEIDMNEVGPDRKSVPEQPWKDFREEIHIVSIVEGVTRICDNAFENCWILSDIYLPSTLKSIGFQSFLSTNVEVINIPDSVTEIEGYAFNYCQNLRTVKLPYGLETLNCSVFNMAPQLERVYAGNRTRFETRMERDILVTPFNSNPDVDRSGNDETALPENLTIYTPQGSSGNLQSPAKEFAEKFGFAYEEGIFRHENAEVFGDAAFGASDVYWALEDGVLTLMGSGETPFYRSGGQDRNAWGKVQPGTVTLKEEAPWYPFRNEIHTVIVEPGITVLNRGVLCDLPNLETLELGKVQRLYEGAIDNCGMESLLLPDSLSYLYKGAISDCPSLRSIEIRNGTEKIDNNAILGCGRLEELRFWNGGEALGQTGDLFGGSVPQNLTIYGRTVSEARKYAEKHNIPFEKLR